ncbi:MAG: hypothetical protein H6742_04225 [Alphaproteobacteria bacterium]|nr:hypothetical protein [Alphaproteobacteria bacterium]
MPLPTVGMLVATFQDAEQGAVILSRSHSSSRSWLTRYVVLLDRQWPGPDELHVATMQDDDGDRWVVLSTAPAGTTPTDEIAAPGPLNHHDEIVPPTAARHGPAERPSPPGRRHTGIIAVLVLACLGLLLHSVRQGQELSATQASLDRARQRVDDARTLLAKSEEFGATQQADASRYAGQVEDLKVRIDGLQDALQRRSTERQSLLTQVQALVGEVDALQSELKATREEAAKTASELATERRLRALAEEVISAQGEALEATQEVALLGSAIYQSCRVFNGPRRRDCEGETAAWFDSHVAPALSACWDDAELIEFQGDPARVPDDILLLVPPGWLDRFSQKADQVPAIQGCPPGAR